MRCVKATFTSTVDLRCLPALRRRRGWTQAELGRRIGAPAELISRLERALQPGETLDRMVAALTGDGADGQE